MAVRLFLHSAALILAIAGIAKVLSAFGTAQILFESDPVLEIPNRLLLLSAGLIELLGCVSVVAARNRMWASAIPLWFGTMFLLYRALLASNHYGGACPCLGSLTGLLRIDPQQATRLLSFLAIYLTTGGAAATCWWRTAGLPSSNGESKGPGA